MFRRHRSRYIKYIVAVVAYVIAASVTSLLWEPLFKSVPFALFFAAVTAVTWVGGFGPGLVVALAGTVTTAYLMSTREQVVVAAPILLFLVAVFICYLIETRARSQRALEDINILLENEQTKLEAVLEQMPGGVMIAKAPSGELILANKRAAEILHHSFKLFESIERHGIFQGFHPDGRPYEPGEYPLSRCVRTGEEVINEEVDCLCEDGARHFISFNSAPVRNREDKIVAAVSVFYDVTDTKQQAERLLHSQKMEAIGQLAGGVAHDFNNLLTVIVGYCQLIVEKSRTPEVRSGIEQIRRAAERASSLTRQLLAFSRKQILQPEIVDINEIVTELKKMLFRLIGEHIHQETRLDGNLRKVKIDPLQMEQVIVNLAVNARDAMPDGGKLTIETENVYLDEEYSRHHTEVVPGWYVRLAVSDTGVGMDDNTRARLFEPFFTTKERGKGTGLGLSTVHGIVRQSGGHIWVYSEIGHGTTFKLYFAVADQEAAPRELAQTKAAPKGSETIMVVEDDDALRELVAMVLTENGYKVLDTGDPTRAVSMCLAQETTIDLLITDVVMPQLSGRRLAQDLALLLPEMRVLYMSGYTDDAIVHHGVLDSGLAFLQKPFTPDTLSRKVREVLDLNSGA
jgi:PAS domain S-box-containing protein